MSIPRNEPCPCGSGKKFKKCCGGAAVRLVDADVDPEIAHANAIKRADKELHDVLMRYMRKHTAEPWRIGAFDEFMAQGEEGREEEDIELAVPWMLFHCPATADGSSVATLMMKDSRVRLPDMQLAVLLAQRETWLSIWEVTAVEPGIGISLTDRLTGVTQFVHERKASHSASVGMALLARVVDAWDVAFIAGLHPQPLMPRFADRAVTAMRKYFRVRTRPVKAERLRDAGAQLDLINVWRMLVEIQHTPPTMTNTDGDVMLLTTDRFDFASARHTAVLAALSALPGATEANSDDDGTEILITRSGGDPAASMNDTVIARIVVLKTHVLVETNSTRRADDSKAAIGAALAGLARFRIREEVDVQDLVGDAREARESGTAPPMPEATPEMDEVLRQFREQYMQKWLDDIIPALGGLTPRQAAADKKHHAALKALLRDVEYHEHQLPAAQRYDIVALRKQLGM